METTVCLHSSNGNLILFRGQHDANWDLVPCIFRPEYRNKDAHDLEEKLFIDFKRRAVPY